MSEVTPLFPAHSSVSREDFPIGFVFGSAASAFQYEGATEEDGRGPSIWEPFLIQNYPDIVAERGLDAIRQYHRFREDIKVMKEMGWDSYRFSISWSRILPLGRRYNLKGCLNGVNKLGVDFYNNLIDELLANGIKPLVTIYHWDCPQALETEYLGFLDRKIVDDFCDYADLCFELFGDRVKHWTTFNEPWSFAIGGYVMGTFAPGRGGNKEMRMSMADFFPGSRATPKIPHTLAPTQGNPKTEPYIVAHHELLAHAAAVKLYREKYQREQNGVIGMTNVTNWEVPYSDSREDQAAAQRAIDFMFGWFVDPITTGDYPSSMRELVGDRLPKFTPEESESLKGSFDYLGVNYYTANYAQDAPDSEADSKVKCTTERNGVPIGEKAGSDWLYVYPHGILDLLTYVKNKYNNPIVYITENGRDELNVKDQSFWVSLFDFKRISYHQRHLSYVKQAIDEGANVARYYIWSLMDNLEWSSGFKTRFGSNFINFNDNVDRYPKLSAAWFKLLLEPDTRNWELYTRGREEGDGRLGLGPGRGPDQAGGLSVPTKVKALPVPVVAVSCGGFFTMALTEEGRLWSWGANSNYELGRGNKIGGWKPQPIPSLENVSIKQIANGGYHSLALTDDGEVLSWGHGGNGQLGHSTTQSEKVPRRIEAFAGQEITYIACGGTSSAAITDNGRLYMWGNSKDCQLGIPGLPEVQSSPAEVKFLTGDDGTVTENVLCVAIGASHAMCLATTNKATMLED